jgi:hypothetical protein
MEVAAAEVDGAANRSVAQSVKSHIGKAIAAAMGEQGSAANLVQMMARKIA